MAGNGKQIPISILLNFTSKMNGGSQTAAGLNAISDSLTKMDKAQSNLSQIGDGLDKLSQQSRPAATWLDTLGRTISNTFRYQIVNAFTDKVLSSGQQISQYLEQVDKQLTQIRVVSGLTRAEANAMVETAVKAASALRTTTAEYLQAQQVYYQQGLSNSEVTARSQATIKAANISGQDVATTAEQVTAVLNGFKIPASEINTTLSAMASLGAQTATDFEELATASQKVASAASNANIPLNNTLAMLATMSSVTRESAESIGTSLNAIIGRFNKLSAEDDGSFYSAIETALKNTKSGISIFDEATGKIRNFHEVLNDLAGAWDGINVNAKKAIVTQLAGTRQANRLLALLDNWDTYQENIKRAQLSAGSIDAQERIYEQSLEGLEKQVDNAGHAMWNSLFSVSDLKEWNSMLLDVETNLSDLFSHIGGYKGVIKSLLPTGLGLAIRGAAPLIANKFVMGHSSDMDVKGLQQRINKVDSNSGLYGVRIDKAERTAKTLSDEQYAVHTKALRQLKEQADLEDKLNKLKEQQKAFDNESFDAVTKTVNAVRERLKLEKQLPKDKKDMYRKAGFGESTVDTEDDLQGEFITEKIVNSKLTSKSFANGRMPKKLTREAYAKATGIDPKSFDEEELKAFTDSVKEYVTDRENYAKVSTASFNTKDLKTLLSAAEATPGAVDQINKSKSFFGKSGVSNFDELEKIAKSGGNLKEALKNYGTTYEKLMDAVGNVANIVNKSSEAAQKELNNANDAVEEHKQNISHDINVIKKEALANDITTFATYVSYISTGITSLFDTIDAALDKGIEGTEKAQKINQSMTGMLSSIGGIIATVTTGNVGIGVAVSGIVTSVGSAIGYLIEKFDLGASASEKLQKSVTEAKKVMTSYTSYLDEEQAALANVSMTADDLAKKYKEQAFTRAELSEQEKTNYDQVAEYVSKYAPQLIEYYDREGKAIIDLSALYGTYGENKKNALDIQYEQDALKAYGTDQVQASVGQNGQILMDQYSKAVEAIPELQSQLYDLRSQALKGKDVADQIDDINKKLSEQQDIVNNLAGNWNQLYQTPLLQGNSAYSTLSGDSQNFMMQLSSYDNFINGFEGTGLTIDGFSSKMTDFMSVFSGLSDDVQERYNTMDESIRQSIADMGMSFDLTNEQLAQFLSTMDEATFISGSFLTEWSQTSAENLSSLQSELDATNQQIDDLKSKKEQAVADQAKAIGPNQNSEYRGTGAAAVDATGYEKATEAVSNYTSAIDNATKHAKDLQAQVSRASTEQTRAFNQWSKGVRDYANSSASSYEKVRQQFVAMQDKIANADGDQKVQLQKNANRLFTILKGNDEAYYRTWVAANSRQVRVAANSYGILASNYKNYNEYMNALDNAQAKARILIQNTTGKSIVEIGEQIRIERYKQLALEAQKAGDTAKAQIYAAATVSNNAKVQAAAQAMAVLEGYQEQISASQDSGELQQESAQEMVNGFGNIINPALKKLGLDTVETGAGISINRGTLKEMTEKAIEKIKNAATDDPEINAAINSVKDYVNDYANLNDLAAGGIDWNDVGYTPSDIDSLPVYTAPEEPAVPEPSGDGGKGKDSGGGSDNDKTTEDYKADIDELKPYTDKINALDHAITVLTKDKEHLYGKDYIKSLDQEVDLQHKSIDAMKAKLDATKRLAEKQKEILATTGAQYNLQLKYDANGNIANYNDILRKMQEISASIGDADQKEAFNDWAGNFKDSMDKYEEYAVSNVKDLEESIAEKIGDLISTQVEQIQYPIQIVVDASEQNQKYLDLLASLAKQKKGTVNFSVDASSSFDKLTNSLNEANAIFGASGNLENLLKQVDSMTSGRKVQDLASAPKEVLDTLRQEEETLIGVASTISDTIGNLRTAFNDGVKNATSALDTVINKLSSAANIYNNILSATEKANTNTIPLLEKVNNSIVNINDSQIAALTTQAKELAKVRDSFVKGTDEYNAANEAYINRLNGIVNLQKESASALEKAIKNMISRNTSDSESLLLGESASNFKNTLKDLTSARSRYLAEEKKIYNLAKLEDTISKDIDSRGNDLRAQKRLQDFMTAELAALRSKQKLKQDDLDLSQKQYALLKAQLDLEEAAAGAAYTRVLQRNSSGNYGYLFVADTTAIDKAQTAYEKAIDDLYKYAETQYNNYLNDISGAVETYDKSVENIISKYQQGLITRDKAQQLVEQARAKMIETYKEDQDKLTEYAQQIAGSTELQKEAQDELLSKTTTEIKTLDALINGDATKTFDDYYKQLTGKDVSDTVFNTMNNGIIDMADNWKQFYDTIQKDISTTNFDNINKNIETIYNSIDKYNKLLSDWQASAENTQNVADATNFLANLAASANQVNNEAGRELETIAETVKKYEDQQKAIQDTTDRLMDLINALDQATQKIESTYGVTNGSIDSILTSQAIGNSQSAEQSLAAAASNSVANSLPSVTEIAKAAGGTVLSQDRYEVNVSFPNATNRDEILDAIKSLNEYTAQYLGNKKESD